MIQVAICDDENCQIEEIKRATEKYFSRKNESVDYSIFQNAFLLLEEFEKKGGFDIVLMDICMPGILGTEAAAEIRKRRDKTEIIFLTTSKEFAIEAFSLHAAHYLVKPFTQDQFDGAMDRAMFGYNKKRSSKVILKLIGGGMRVISIDDILYIESAAHIQNIHLNTDTCIKVRQSQMQMLDLFNNIAPGQFVSPYKGYIVNQKEIRTIKTGCIEMCNGKEIPLVKHEYRQFQKDYFTYIFQSDH